MPGSPAASAASFGRKPYGATAAAHGTPVTGRLRSPPYPAAAPASITTRAVSLAPYAPVAERMSQPVGPERRALSGLAPPAGLTARARPSEARPDRRARRTPKLTGHVLGTGCSSCLRSPSAAGVRCRCRPWLKYALCFNRPLACAFPGESGLPIVVQKMGASASPRDLHTVGTRPSPARCLIYRPGSGGTGTCHALASRPGISTTS